MKTVGIIAEYNPFHSGHAYQLKEAQKLLKKECTVVIMSGSFVQRGEPACADKFTRARWAAQNGASMVLELPDVFSLSCAERFASEAIRILNGTGLVDSICFGSESGDIEKLERIADAGFSEERFKTVINAGASYPKALSSAYEEELGPNDILGLEYLKAIKKYGCDLDTVTVKRETGYNDPSLGPEMSSALAIRSALSRSTGETRISPQVFDCLARSLPRGVLEDVSSMMKKGEFPSTCEGLSDVLLYKLRSMDPESIALLPEVSEGLENLFYSKALSASSFYELMNGVKSKRYTMARLKRIAMCALLGITREMQDEAAEDDSHLYIRVLAVRKDSTELLSQLIEKASLPVIVKAADREKLPPKAKSVERVSSLAHIIRALGQPYEKAAIPDSSNRLITV